MYVNVQMQNGLSDSGLFAVAFAVALCEGKDPHICSYDQEQTQMCMHLVQCLHGEGRNSSSEETKTLHRESEVN